MSKVDILFGKRVRAARKALDMTQDELARKVGLSIPSICRIERADRVMIRVETLTKLTKALGCMADHLIFGDSPKDSYSMKFESLFKSMDVNQRGRWLILGRLIKRGEIR